jgi:sarcosine oxidase subunit beta
MAFANNARRLGVEIIENTAAQRIMVEGHCILGVIAEDIKILSPIVANTAGPWASLVSKMVNLPLPVNPYRRQVFVTKEFHNIPKPVPMTIDMDELFYYRGDPPGILMGMSDLEEKSSYDTHVDREFLEKIVEKATHRVHTFRNAEILRGWAGLYATTPDENPIIGPTEGVDGFYQAVGFSGHGFQHGPAVGQILAELIEMGKTTFDLSPFCLTRFKSIRGKGEKRAV